MDENKLEPVDNDFFPMFSDKEMARRHDNVRKEMADRELDAIIVHGCLGVGNSPGQVNLQYLSRYAALVETFLIVPAEGQPTMFLALPFHVPNALDISYVKDIRSGDCLQNMIKYIKDLRLEVGRIGIVGPGAVQYRYFTLFTEQKDVLTENLPDAKFENATPWFNNLLLIKSDEELAVLRRAGAITDLAHEEVFQMTRPGVSHTDLRRIMDMVAARHGATSPFGHISSCSMKNPTSLYPDCYPTGKRVKAGDFLMTEFTLGFGNYWGKIWGTWFVGNPTPEYEKLFNVAALVHDNLVYGLKTGMKGSEIASFLQPIYDAGLEQTSSFLVSGWSAMNQFPFMGAGPNNPYAIVAHGFDDFELKVGHAITLHVWVRIPNTQKGLWVGSSGAFTEQGYQSFNHYPISTLRVVPI
jgi:Xaa-Pro aminopeptidase